MKFFFSFILILGLNYSFGAQFDTLYINRGVFTAVNGETFPYLAFNTNPVFNQQNAALKVPAGETLILTVINTDSVTHGFTIKNFSQYALNVQDTITDTLFFAQQSVHSFYDHLQYPVFKNSGLCGVIYVTANINENSYVWNLKDHQSSIQNDLVAGNPANWLSYLPDYFTINEKSFADIQNDPLIRIDQNVGDTIFIYVVNAGQSMHSLHFHGFHQEVVYADCRLIENGWVKDTWGMFSMDAFVLRMIPDKSGEYSVHDHNLVALSAGSTHPNGMFTIMLINP